MNTKRRFSAYTQRRLEEAGWFLNRNVEEEVSFPKDVEIFSSALEVITEFGKLQIGIKQSGKTGITLAKSPVWIDPNEAYYLEEFQYAQDIIKERIYPFGLVNFDTSARGTLYINETGAVFCIDDFDWFYDNSFDRALEKMLEGIKPIPLQEAQW